MKTLSFALLTLLLSPLASALERPLEQRFIQIDAKTRETRTLASTLGMSIEFLRTDSSWGFADAQSIQAIEAAGIQVLGNFDASVGRGGHGGATVVGSGPGFPEKDSFFHDYAEVKAELFRMERENPEMAKVHVIGTSIEGREIYALQINTDRNSLRKGKSNKPGAIFMGTHHAREHLSTEIPLRFADYLLKNKVDAKLSALIDGRDTWLVPLVNPDGSEHDISTGNYKSWRKNRRPNGDGTFGVDLNRNYGFQWGTGGSSNNTNSDVYMGEKPFSEPETQVVKAFVENHLNAKILLSFHTFSELILYPWGHKYDPVETPNDLKVFQTMAQTMSVWNGYTPQQSSDLYIASGDTVDWAYGEHGIFAFTFELTPASIWQGGFYPGQEAIEPTFAANLKPLLYMLELADDPYRVLTQESPIPDTPKKPTSKWPKAISARNSVEIHPYHF